MFTSSIRLQITIDLIIISTKNASNFDIQNQNQNQRRLFQFKFNQFFKSNENRFDKIQRMYQINVKNEKSNATSNQIDEHNIDKNENENIYYEQYEKISNNRTNSF